MTHLTDVELAAWLHEGAGRGRVVDHLASCDDCGARCAEMVRTEPPAAAATVLEASAFADRGRRVWRDVNGRARGWRWAAAGLAAAAALTFVVVNRPAAPPASRRAEAGVVRGGSLRAIAPAGDARLPLSFRWSSPFDAASYRVEVSDATHVIYSAATSAESFDAPSSLAALLAPGEGYSWRIVALDASGDPLAASPSTAFVLARR